MKRPDYAHAVPTRTNEPSTCRIRVADASDIEEIVRITNAAYQVERFCIEGDRTDAEDVRAQMADGQFLVAQTFDSQEQTVGSVFFSIRSDRVYMGMLAVDPRQQGRGIARALIREVECKGSAAGANDIDITVINLRTELFPFYASFGFASAAQEPYFRPAKAILPLHLVRMTKALKRQA